MDNILDILPLELVTEVMRHLLTSNLPLVDPRPPLVHGKHLHKECEPSAKVHQSLNPASAYCARDGIEERLQDFLAYFVGSEIGGPLDTLRFEHGLSLEALRACEALNNAGDGLLFSKCNSIAFTHVHNLKCFVRSYPEAAAQIKKVGLAVKVEYIMAGDPYHPHNKRVFRPPPMLKVDLSAFANLQELVVHFYTESCGFPGEGKNARGMLKGVDLAHWLGRSGWQVPKAKITGLDYVKAADTTLLQELEDIITMPPQRSVASAILPGRDHTHR